MGELASGDQSNEAAFQEQRPADGLWADWCQGTGKPRPTVVLESGPDQSLAGQDRIGGESPIQTREYGSIPLHLSVISMRLR